MSLRKKKIHIRESVLSSGERILIRQLSPAERLHCLSLPGDINLSKRLSLGMIRPKTTIRKAAQMLNRDPFRALEILRAIQSFSRESDLLSLKKWNRLQDERFLETLTQIERLKGNHDSF